MLLSLTQVFTAGFSLCGRPQGLGDPSSISRPSISTWMCHTSAWRPSSLSFSLFVRATGWPPSTSRKPTCRSLSIRTLGASFGLWLRAMFTAPPSSDSSAEPTPDSRSKCLNCPRRMSAKTADCHTVCVVCRGYDCNLETRCEECIEWPDEEIRLYAKMRKSLKSKGSSKSSEYLALAVRHTVLSLPSRPWRPPPGEVSPAVSPPGLGLGGPVSQDSLDSSLPPGSSVVARPAPSVSRGVSGSGLLARRWQRAPTPSSNVGTGFRPTRFLRGL